MIKDNILNLFQNCSFENLNSFNFKEHILNKLPNDFKYDYCYGASKLVILPEDENGYVIKIPFLGTLNIENGFYNFTEANGDIKRNWDYCFSELLIYHEAKQKKVNKILAKPHFIGNIHNYPIYIQEKAETYDLIKEEDILKRNSNKATHRIYKICNENDYVTFNLDWITDVYNYYGEKHFNKIMEFVSSIGDLHDTNVGYIGYKPVIFDFSDFNS